MGQWIIKTFPLFNRRPMKNILKCIGIGEDKNTHKWIQLLIFQQ